MRVVITGIGVVSPFGIGRERFWSHVSRGCSGVRQVRGAEDAGGDPNGPEPSQMSEGFEWFDVRALPCRVAAPVPRMDESEVFGLSRQADPRRYARVSRIAVVAAREAWADAGLELNEPDAGVVVGSGAGGIDIAEEQYREYFSGGGTRRVTPYAIPISIVGIVSSEISIALELHGISHVLSTGCTSSTDAIGYAARMIRSGEAEVLLTGGADACVTPGMLLAFSRMRVMSTSYNDRPAEASRPFDGHRDGFVLGEGAWMLVLEREDRARARGAHLYATIEGYGSTCDAYHRVQMAPDGKQIMRAMQLAIARSGRPIETIGYVNFHGTSTQLNDAVEARCVRQVFGARADRVPGSSTKSMIGHPQGASGAAGIVTAALALTREFLPPTINQQHPDPECDVDVIPNVGRAATVEAALCNCLGFGSKNSAIVLGRADA